VRGAAVIIVDDLASTGTTITRAAQASRERGATEVHASVTHGLFTTDAAASLGSADIDSIVATDSVGDVRARCPALGGRLVVLESAPLFAAALRRLAHVSTL
jgi:ribose-phosphate pyrophosphokinase